MNKLPDEVMKETNTLLDELTKELSHEERQPGDVDAYQLSKTTGLTREQCSRLLNDRANRGELIKVEVRGNSNRPVFVYRKVKSS